MRSLHDVAVAFFVGDDAHIVPTFCNMPSPAAQTHKTNCHCEGAKRLRQSVSRLPARSALLPAAEVSTGHPRSLFLSERSSGETDCFALLAMTPGYFCSFVSGFACGFFALLQRLRLCRAVMPAPTISPEMRKGGTHGCVPYTTSPLRFP